MRHITIRRLSFLLTMVLAVGLLGNVAAAPQDDYTWRYSEDKKKAIITEYTLRQTQYKGGEKEVIIPDKLGGEAGGHDR